MQLNWILDRASFKMDWFRPPFPHPVFYCWEPIKIQKCFSKMQIKSNSRPIQFIHHFLVLFPNAGDPSRCGNRKKCNSKFRNNAVLASYKQPNPCCYQVLFNFLHHPPIWRTPIISKEDSTKALLLQVTRKSIWFLNTLQMQSHFFWSSHSHRHQIHRVGTIFF
jgi:hypothetical protein